jgi:enoyl-[acyl-carrier protein] reductase II
MSGPSARGLVNMGTRFVASSEFAGSDDWKNMILDVGPEDTVQTDALEPIMPPYTIATPWHGKARMLRTPFPAKWDGRTDELADRADVLGTEMIDAILAGNGHEYPPFAGQSAGLMDDILPAQSPWVWGAVVTTTAFQFFDQPAALGEFHRT